MKIYDTDPEVYARTTKIKAIKTKHEIDGLFAKFGIKDVWWHGHVGDDDIYLAFKLPPEKFGHLELKNLTVKLEPPRIWHKGKHKDEINWNVSIRNLYWYILTHLSQAYVMQSSKITEFLPYILHPSGKILAEALRPELHALPEVVKQP